MMKSVESTQYEVRSPQKGQKGIKNELKYYVDIMKENVGNEGNMREYINEDYEDSPYV